MIETENERVRFRAAEIRATADGLDARRIRGHLPSESEIKQLLDAVRAAIDDPTVTRRADLVSLFDILRVWSARLTLYYSVLYDPALKRTPKELSELMRDSELLEETSASTGSLMVAGHLEAELEQPTVHPTLEFPDSFGAAMFGFSSSDDKEEEK